MILYRPTDGDVQTTPISIRTRTCFIMTKLGAPIPDICLKMRGDVERVLEDSGFDHIDADSEVTGRDFLQKIWNFITSVPMGIAVIYKDMPSLTLANIFYELGWMQALGKETLVIKTKDVQIPSDLVRTEYVTYDAHFSERLHKFLRGVRKRADYLALVAEQVENNPLLAIDYYRRAYLLTGDDQLRQRAIEVLEEARLEHRAKNSVEMLLAGFALPLTGLEDSTAEAWRQAGASEDD